MPPYKNKKKQAEYMKQYYQKNKDTILSRLHEKRSIMSYKPKPKKVRPVRPEQQMNTSDKVLFCDKFADNFEGYMATFIPSMAAYVRRQRKDGKEIHFSRTSATWINRAYNGLWK